MKLDTTVRVSQATKIKLKLLGKKGQTYNEIIRDLLDYAWETRKEERK